MRHTAELILILFLMTFGCGRGERPSGSTETGDLGAAATTAPAPDLEPDDPSLLRRPFTADEIRDEWVFRLLMQRSIPEETRVERWTVVAADDEGAEIEYATIADDGTVVGEPSVARSGWVELRDHASFPAAHSSREWASRSTMLGDFEGWLYRVAEPSAGTVREFFFVPSLPGAPVQMRILEGETTVLELEQIARLRPDGP